MSLDSRLPLLQRVLARRGARVVYDVQGGSGREMFTILAGGSASGITKIKVTD